MYIQRGALEGRHLSLLLRGPVLNESNKIKIIWGIISITIIYVTEGADRRRAHFKMIFSKAGIDNCIGTATISTYIVQFTIHEYACLRYSF